MEVPTLQVGFPFRWARAAAHGQNGYRIYGNDAIKLLLLFVRRAQSLGIT